MIPRAYITAWRAAAPWADDAQVEQDLVLSRAIVEIFSDSLIAGSLAFRGGTALNKLYFDPPARYSEDIDLVQIAPGPLGDVMTALRNRLDPWLGAAKYKQSEGRVTLTYRFESETPPVTPMKVKVEINTREHFTVLGLKHVPFEVMSPWFAGRCEIPTYELPERLGTKLRALYQRRKGRDAFDLAIAADRFPGLDLAQIVTCFERYMDHGGTPVSRAEYEANIAEKLVNAAFLGDIGPLLATNANTFALADPRVACEWIGRDLFCRLSGEPWKGSA